MISTRNTLQSRMGRPSGRGAAVVGGAVAAALLGLAAGWLRYWFGFFVLFQGAACGLLIAWLAGRAGRRDGRGPDHPGFRNSILVAGVWFIVFIAGLTLGLGLAQPWFDPFGWLSRLWDGRTGELAFGIASRGGVAHGAFAMGAKGGFWLVLNGLDWLIMFFFLMTMAWDTNRGRERRDGDDADAGEGAAS